PVRLGYVLERLANALLLMGRRDEALAAYSELTPLVAALPTSRLTLASQALGGHFANEDGDAATALSRFEAGVAMANTIGADGWADVMLFGRIMADRTMPAEAAIPQLRDLLARIRPDHMFSGGGTVGTIYALAERLAERDGPGDLDEAFALARSTEKVL